VAESDRPTLFEPEEKPIAPATPAVVETVVPEPAFEPEPEVIEEPVEKARRNPWLIVLWIIGIALTALGLWGLFQAAERALDPTYVLVAGYGSEQYRTPDVEDFYVVPIILASLSPWLTALGIGSIIAASTVHAVHWSRRG
jgi:hypothetical protein